MIGSSAKKVILTLLVVVLIAIAVFAYFKFKKAKTVETPVTPVVEETTPKRAVIGHSVQNREIESYTFGSGDTHVVFVGGMHGGYEWNSTLLAYEAMDYFKANPSVIPSNLKVTVIPSANPDGLFKIIGKEGRFTDADVKVIRTETPGLGRFNAHDVDLNRNFACKWKPEATWRSQKVSAGTAAFSEPEAQAIRDFVLKEKPKAVVFWHSQANAVYASECEKGVLPETLALMNAYAKGAGYPAVSSFDAYPVSGDAEGWLASINIPAITVEMKTHETTEWDKNVVGIKAVLSHFTATSTTP